MQSRFRFEGKYVRLALFGGAALVIGMRYAGRLGAVATMLMTGAVLAFIMDPLVGMMGRRGVRQRGIAVGLAFLLVLMLSVGMALLLMPALIAQGKELSFVMARSVNELKSMLYQLNKFLSARQLPQIDAHSVDWGAMTQGLSSALPASAAIAGGMIERVSQFGLSLLLAFYFLLYKDSLLLSLELCVPMAARSTVTRMAAQVVGELRQYLRGQLTIAAIVGLLSAAMLLIIGAPSAILMGLIMGITNLIPYFGPLIGAIPAVVMSLPIGMGMALSTVLVAFLVQQIDGFWLGPRIMGGMMGVSPPIVLIAITVGGRLCGIGGMFFAIPVVIVARICLRVWMMREELVEKWPKM